MHLGTELPYKVDVSFELFCSDGVKVKSEQHAVGIFSRTESEKKLAELESSPVAPFSA
jgi:hypothetical protein